MAIHTTAMAALIAALLGGLAAVPALYVLAEPPVRKAALAPAKAENWPICTSMDALADGPAWAPLDPDFAAGKKALAANDWNAAIAVLTSAALRDARNADLQNYLGYAYSRLRQLEPAFKHYQQALAFNPRHRGAHQHLGQAYLLLGDRANAAEHLAALERICLIPCEEYENLQRAIAIDARSAMR
jgi:tetratricopeptide (TPR) repeat protein